MRTDRQRHSDEDRLITTLYYHKGLKMGIVTRDGMPALVLTDDRVQEYESFINAAQKVARQVGKTDILRAQLDIILRYPDEKVGWQKL